MHAPSEVTVTLRGSEGGPTVNKASFVNAIEVSKAHWAAQEELAAALSLHRAS